MQLNFLTLILLAMMACSDDNQNSDMSDQMDVNMPEDMDNKMDGSFAIITKVSTSGSENAYNFSVTVSSPDTGCEQYADWWEAVSENGDLIYRRVLGHSHVTEQPFTRSGGSVKISASQKVWVRAHLNTTGYGTQAFFGSVDAGFEENTTADDFASGLDQVEPLPGDCAF